MNQESRAFSHRLRQLSITPPTAYLVVRRRENRVLGLSNVGLRPYPEVRIVFNGVRFWG
jgi:hypothetical protein